MGVDYEQAVYWLNLAAEQINAEAQNLLGQCYENGWGVELDLDRAKEYYVLAVSNGYSG